MGLEVGKLVFDVGAYKGQKTRQYLAQGASVVAFEPVPELAKNLRGMFNGDVMVDEHAISDHSGPATLHICSKAKTISTLSSDWKTGRFKDYVWDRDIEVQTMTLDEAIEKYGLPDYIKLDIEGYEEPAIKGLSRRVPLISFEYTEEFSDIAIRIVEQLEQIGFIAFAVCSGKSSEPTMWFNRDGIIKHLQQLQPKAWGDIYAM